MARSLKFHQFIALVFFIFAVAGGLYQLHLYKQHQDEIHAQRLKAEQAQKEKERAELDTLFDQYLVDFQVELKEKAVAYKSSRNILKEILSPYNFETKEYTKENYLLFRESIAPDLRKKAAEIIDIFAKYKNDLQTDLDAQDNKVQEMFLLKWKDMSNEQLAKYIAFFTKEEELTQAYETLITFYYVHSNLFSVDVKENVFLFDREEDNEKERELRNKIKNLRKR